MQVYLVGGAVRDQLLGLPISDRDWLVLGATPNDLIKLGFEQVGKGFPVFLHPKTHEEYALARIEYKTGLGYTGFSCYTTPNITIKEDLSRRDLTINAIAQTKNGKLIDPFNGKQDIRNRLLRHVSTSFTEDPLRILRVARFAAQLAKQKFTIAAETHLLMKKMVYNHDINMINAKRIWRETKKSLQTSAPEIYFNILHDCGALSIFFPEINKLIDIPFTTSSYSKIRINTFLTLKVAALLTNDIETRFAALCHDFSKVLIPPKLHLNYHNEYTTKTISLIEDMCNRFSISNKMKELPKLVAKFYTQIHKINKLQPKNIIDLFNELDSWRKPKRINQLAIVCKADAQSYLKQKHLNAYPQAKFVIEAFKIVQQVSSKNIIKDGIKGTAIKDKLTQQRIQKLTNWQQQQTILPI